MYVIFRLNLPLIYANMFGIVHIKITYHYGLLKINYYGIHSDLFGKLVIRRTCNSGLK